MIIACPNCSTKFKIADEKILPGGIKVRCSKCENIFRVAPETAAGAETPPAPPPAPVAPPPAMSGLADKFFPGSSSDLGSTEDVNLDFDIGGDESAPSPPPASPPPASPPPAPPPRAAAPAAPSLSSDDVFDFPAPEIKAKTPEPPPPVLPPQTAMGHNPLQDLESAVDSGLDQLLNAPSDLPDFVTDPSPPQRQSSIPLTMPQDIDLAALARSGENKAPGAAGRFTDDGIELLSPGSQSSDSFSTPSFDAPVAPPPPAKAKAISTDSPAFPAKRNAPAPFQIPPPPPEPRAVKSSSKLPIILVSVLVFFAAVGALLIWMTIKVHGSFSFDQMNADTLQAFLNGSGPAAKSPRLPPSTPGAPNQVVLDKTGSVLIRNFENRSILVISGEARNNFSEPRSLIKIKATIFSPGGKPLTEMDVWAGNHFDRDEIYYFPDQAAIDRAFSSTGRNLANLNVAPGAAVPFQILIMDPPRDWDEFSVVVSSSQQAGGS